MHTFMLLAIGPVLFLTPGDTMQTATADVAAKAAATASTVQVQLLVCIFVMRIVMLIASAAAYFINGFIAKAKYGKADQMNYEAPLTSLVWITSTVSIALTHGVSAVVIPSLPS